MNAHDQHWHNQFSSSNARNQPTVETSEDEERSEAWSRHKMQVVIVVYVNAETKCGFGLFTSIGVINSVRYLQSRLIRRWERGPSMPRPVQTMVLIHRSVFLDFDLPLSVV